MTEARNDEPLHTRRPDRPLRGYARRTWRGTRLRIVRLLLSAHPEGLVVGEIGAELGIPPSTLSHHLDKLKNEELVSVRRESTFLRYTANTQALQEIVGFLFAECCTRNKAIRPEDITCA